MIDVVRKRMAHGAAFLTINASAILFVALFVVVPVWAHFAERGEEISENVAQLSHFQALARNAKALMSNVSKVKDPFLPGNEERLVSADLQASLKAVATGAGVRLLGIRGLQGGRSPGLHMVAVQVELEGAMPAIRNVLLAIENQMPFLFVTAVSLRSVTDGDDGIIKAELKVQGAMRDREPQADALAISSE